MRIHTRRFQGYLVSYQQNCIGTNNPNSSFVFAYGPGARSYEQTVVEQVLWLPSWKVCHTLRVILELSNCVLGVLGCTNERLVRTILAVNKMTNHFVS
jgi:hypothetical protein